MPSSWSARSPGLSRWPHIPKNNQPQNCRSAPYINISNSLCGYLCHFLPLFLLNIVLIFLLRLKASKSFLFHSHKLSCVKTLGGLAELLWFFEIQLEISWSWSGCKPVRSTPLRYFSRPQNHNFVSTCDNNSVDSVLFSLSFLRSTTIKWLLFMLKH